MIIHGIAIFTGKKYKIYIGKSCKSNKYVKSAVGRNLLIIKWNLRKKMKVSLPKTKQFKVERSIRFAEEEINAFLERRRVEQILVQRWIFPRKIKILWLWIPSIFKKIIGTDYQIILEKPTQKGFGMFSFSIG